METLLDNAEGVMIALLEGAKDPVEVEGLICLLEEVSEEQGWRPEGQLQTHWKVSTYFAAYVDGALAGGVQLVLGSRVEALPCLLVWPELQILDTKHAAYVAVLAIRRPFRARRDLLWRIMVEVWRWCDQKGIGELRLEATPATLRRYRLLGWPLCVVGPLRSHWNEDCFPCTVGMRELADALVCQAQTSMAHQRRLAQAER